MAEYWSLILLSLNDVYHHTSQSQTCRHDISISWYHKNRAMAWLAPHVEYCIFISLLFFFHCIHFEILYISFNHQPTTDDGRSSAINNKKRKIVHDLVGILIKRINGEWEAVKDAQEIAFTNMCAPGEPSRRRGRNERIDKESHFT